MSNYTKTRPWSLWILIVISIAYLPASEANSIKVKKIKGQQAIVEISGSLEEGKTYNLEGESLTLSTDFSQQFRSRYNAISAGFNFNFLTGTKTQDSTFNFFGKYGWNHAWFEFGPVINIEIYDKGFGVNTTYLIGGYFDYNMTENKFPREWIYGPSAQLSLGNRNFESGGSAQLAQAQLSGFLMWYINQSSVAIRGELGYQIRRVSSTDSETTLTGAASQLYLIFYY